MSVREKVLANAATPKVPQAVETAFGTVYVRKMEAREWTAFRDKTLDKSDAAQVVAIACDQFGVALFGEKDIPELERVEMAFPVALLRAFNEANGLSGPKASAPSGDSPTASPPTSAGPT